MNKYILVMFCFMSPFGYANTTCVGKVNAVAVNPDAGHMKFNYGYGHNVHCNFNTEYNGVTPEACKILFSQLLAAQISGKSIEARYNDDFECTAENIGDHVQTKHNLYQVQIIN